MVFPTKDDESADTVMIIGRKEEVKKAKELLQSMVKEQVSVVQFISIYRTSIGNDFVREAVGGEGMSMDVIRPVQNVSKFTAV